MEKENARLRGEHERDLRIAHVKRDVLLTALLNFSSSGRGDREENQTGIRRAERIQQRIHGHLGFDFQQRQQNKLIKV